MAARQYSLMYLNDLAKCFSESSPKTLRDQIFSFAGFPTHINFSLHRRRSPTVQVEIDVLTALLEDKVNTDDIPEVTNMIAKLVL